MSAKFLITGDWHYRGSNPVARLDNFQAALNDKILQVRELAERYNVDAIIQSGDIFDSPSVNLSTVADLAKLLLNFPCPILSVPGNHDIWAANQQSKSRTPFGFLAWIEILHDLSERPYKAGNTVVSGCGFDADTDTEAGLLQFNPPEDADEDALRIHVVHSMLLKEDPGFDMLHSRISDVDTTADIIVSGHYHAGFGVVKRKDGVLFINPGAICRLTAHASEMSRQVQVALLTIEDDKAKAKLIPLNVRDAEEVLSRAHLEAAEERQERIERFLSLLSTEGETRFLETREIIERIARGLPIPREVVSEALRRIDIARESLEGGRS